MSNPKSPFQFERHLTGDGSPTLSLNGGEKMHSLEGALSESLYIYGPCIEGALEAPTPRLLSMGLGLGYNEMIAAALILQKAPATYFILSFESQAPLRQHFVEWLQGQDSPLNEVYDTILRQISEHFARQEEEIKSFLNRSLSDGKLELAAALPDTNTWGRAFHGILYDAFSGETDSHLWTEEHLRNFLKEFADPDLCLLATYAATGNLKRSLREAGFQIEKKGGFGKKRESTFAIRS